jgi:type I restriction enzyme M protein
MTEIEEKGWSLNPGRYVGIAERETVEDFEFLERLEELHEELEGLDRERRVLKDRISDSVSQLLEGLS